MKIKEFMKLLEEFDDEAEIIIIISGETRGYTIKEIIKLSQNLVQIIIGI